MRQRTVAATVRLAALVGAGFLQLIVVSRGHAQNDSIRETAAPSRPRAHDAMPVATVARLHGQIQLDGRLDEPEWLQVAPVTEFLQSEPADGVPATERTEVYLLYDDDALYVGARLYDSGRVRKRLGRRDTFLQDSDWFYVMLDGHHDHLTAYQFSINPAGVQRDELTSGGGRGDVSWDAIWESATSIDDAGWIAELRIPFSQLRFGREPEPTWGVQLSRRINRKQEVVVFSHTSRSERGGVARYGHLVGLRGLRPDRTLEVQPYTMVRAEHVAVAPDDPYRDGSDYYGGAGMDVKYRVTSSMTLDATMNPDFGQVELDPAVVNLTAFETSFEEKRPFFVEGSNVFSFGPEQGGGGGGGRRGVFYSRRIGRAPQGSLPDGVAYSNRPDAATILGAAKLTGRTASGLSIGLLGAATAEETAPWTDDEGRTGASVVEPATAYVVGRARQDLRAGQTTIGGIGTLTQRDLGDASLAALLRQRAVTGGLDFRHEFFDRSWSTEGYITFSHVSGSRESIQRTQLSSARYYARPDADHLQLDSMLTSLGGYSARLEVGKRAGLHWRGEANISATSPGYEVNDLGFETTVDRIGTDINLTYVENRPSQTFRSYRITLNGTGDWNFGGDMIVGRASLNLNAELSSYWSIGGSVSRSLDTWDDRLTRGGPIARDPGGFNISANVSSDSRRRVTGRVNTNYSHGAGDWHHGLSFNASLRPAEFWTLSFGPRIDRSFRQAQYLTSVSDTLMTATYGRRYIFAPLRQNTVSMDTRLNLNLSPALSVELYAQPFAASAEYHDPAQLHAPRSFTFDRFGRDVGTVAYHDSTRSYTIDPDGAGPASGFTVDDDDFVRRSLRGNAVVRWEWRPGSTLFLVWQQRRSGRVDDGRFEIGRDVRGVFDAPPDNVFVIKMNYWLSL